MPRCESCFGPEVAGALCDACARLDRSDLALPLGARLQHGRYLIGRTLGDPGGFGITYLGWDTSLERRVAIKEYFPRHLVSRAAGSGNPTPGGASSAGDYEAGLRGFLDEARRLAKLDHPDIVKVHDYCEANGTGYLVMNYYEGHDLRSHVARAGGTLEWQEAVSILLPLLDGLAEVHRAGLIHRDIKPANVYLATLADGKLRPILIDFGAARWATTTHELTSILTEGFAPLEQYPGCGPQGPYTDVYAAAATLYAVVSGRVPASAPARLTHAYVPHLADQVAGVPRRLGDAIDQAMSIQAENRPQSAAEFARALRAAAGPVTSRLIAPAPSSREAAPTAARAPVSHDTPTVPATAVEAAASPTEPMGSKGAAPARRPSAVIGYAVAAIAVVAALSVYVFRGPGGARRAGGTAPGDGPAAPTATADSVARHIAAENEANRQARYAISLYNSGDYSAAMTAAAALHDVSQQAGIPALARTEWATRADSIARGITAGCAKDREMSQKRGLNVPPCPTRGW